MKKKICYLLLAAILLFALTACGEKTSPADKEETASAGTEEAASTETEEATSTETEESTSTEIDETTPTETNEPTTPDTVQAAAQKGSRSDPYEFGEDIVITSNSWRDNCKINYTINFSEVWGPDKISSEYSGYQMKDRILLRGTISVSCDTTDDELYFGLYPVFLTDSLNEESAYVETYKSGTLNNHLNSVYSGGKYDVIVLASDDGISSMTIPYLKIGYEDESGQNANVWVSLPETIIDTPVEDTSSTGEENTSLSKNFENGLFIMSPEEFSQKMPENLKDRDTGMYADTIVLEDDTFGCGIGSDFEGIAAIMFNSPDGMLTGSDKDRENAFESIVVRWETDDDDLFALTEVMYSVIMVLDGELDEAGAVEVAKAIVDAGEQTETYEYNGIKYFLPYLDGGFLFIASVNQD